AHDGAGEFVGHRDFYRHDRLKQSRLGHLHRLLEGNAARHLERQVVRVHIVIRAVVEDYSEIHYRKSCEVTASSGILDSFFYRRNEVSWNRAAKNVVDELELPATRQRLHFDFAIAVLAVPAGLLLVASLHVGLAPDGFAIRDLGSF